MHHGCITKMGCGRPPGFFFRFPRVFFSGYGVYIAKHTRPEAVTMRKGFAPLPFSNTERSPYSGLDCAVSCNITTTEGLSHIFTYPAQCGVLFTSWYFMQFAVKKSWNILQPLLCRSFHDCLLSMSLKWKTTIISSLGRNQDKWTTDGKQVKAAVPVYTAMPAIPLMAAGGRCHLLSSILVPNWDGETPWESPPYEAPYFLFFLEQ